MRVKRKGSIWEVTQFIEEHTHETIKKLGLKKYLRSHKKIPKEEKKFIDLLDSVNLSAGRIMDIMSELYGTGKAVPYDTKTISNYMASIDEKQNVKDIPELLSYFEELKKEDPNFFYKYKLDSEDRVENICWVDGPTREVYKNYNDCISFDTTYMTNAYKMPCAPIIGINRYGQTIQLGCGFLRNEKISNFVWLFEQFLDAMDGLHPLNIITDQDAAITTAIQEMFPNSCHRNCRWHIMQNAQGSPLGPFMAKHEELRREFNEIVDYNLTPVEFENRWGEMIERHGVSDNTDLAYLYEIRAKFVPAYFMDRFFPFLQTTARSEGFNAVLKRYVDPNASLLRFFKQYMKLQERIDITEDSHEFVVNACASEKTDEVARKHMRAMEAEFAAMKKQAANALKRKKKQKETVPPCAEHAETTENPSSSIVGAEHNMHVNKKARDPPLTVTKGRPEEKRKKSGLHLKPAKPTKCTICGSSLHNPRDCPSKIAMKEKTPIIQLFQ
ncbi:hypothetical protein QYE76_010203 [Lolium multiflorum]|uniref:MULE transposase domain-containing protein n=1 Tax=Lolium multiflorum TaxID=4521 RepID=A0AAD8TUI1_LOLMU|nr:hypothetical protein QYE76_010203 [Lolium multiflorum]